MTRRATTSPADFAKRLREAQAEASLTTEELARKMDVGLRIVQRWRAGETTPSGENLVTLAAALEREPAWFYAPHEQAREAA